MLQEFYYCRPTINDGMITKALDRKAWIEALTDAASGCRIPARLFVCAVVHNAICNTHYLRENNSIHC